MHDFTPIVQMQNDAQVMFAGGREWYRRADPKAFGQMLLSDTYPMNLNVASSVEGFELFPSAIRYKWWNKKFAMDRDNVLVELVDILHFAMSRDLAPLLLEAAASDEAVSPSTIYNVVNVAMNKGLYEAADSISKIEAVLTFPAPEATQHYARQRLLFKLLGRLLNSDTVSLSELATAVTEGWENGAPPQIAVKVERDHFPWKHYWMVLMSFGFTVDELQVAYKAKCGLNFFRQANGDKEGNYTRTWFEQEDNVYVTGLLRANPNLTWDELKQELTEAYAMVTRAKNDPTNLAPTHVQE